MRICSILLLIPILSFGFEESKGKRIYDLRSKLRSNYISTSLVNFSHYKHEGANAYQDKLACALEISKISSLNDSLYNKKNQSFYFIGLSKDKSLGVYKVSDDKIKFFKLIDETSEKVIAQITEDGQEFYILRNYSEVGMASIDGLSSMKRSFEYSDKKYKQTIIKSFDKKSKVVDPTSPEFHQSIDRMIASSISHLPSFLTELRNKQLDAGFRYGDPGMKSLTTYLACKKVYRDSKNESIVNAFDNAKYMLSKLVKRPKKVAVD